MQQDIQSESCRGFGEFSVIHVAQHGCPHSCLTMRYGFLTVVLVGVFGTHAKNGAHRTHHSSLRVDTCKYMCSF